MDIAPVYELKNRLRAAAIAGTGLLKEDFRLARAIEGFKPLAGASPVFKRIAELSDTLLADDCPDTVGTLLDLLSLTDSVICTLGVTGVKGEVVDLETPTEGNIVINAPYSVLHELLSALTTSGSGHYNFLKDQHNMNRHLFSDYRVIPALVQALGASYSETANEAENWLCEQGKAVIPLLKKGFDPKGKKEMARRVKVIDMISGAEENEFYLENLDSSVKDIRYCLIYALRHSKENVAKLSELCDKEKGGKKYAMSALAQIDCDESMEYFRRLAEKKPDDALEALRYASSDRACDTFADILGDVLTKNQKTLTQHIQSNRTALNFVHLFFGKHGKKVQDLLRQNEDYTELVRGLRRSLIFSADEDMMHFTEQWYNETDNKLTKVTLMPALVIAKLMGKEDCTDWLREILAEGWLFDGKRSTAEAMKSIEPCDEGDGLEFVVRYYGIFDEAIKCTRRIEQPMDKIIDVLIENADDNIIKELGGWAILARQKNSGEKLRQRLGDYFSKLVLVRPEINMIQAYLRSCGREDFHGVTAVYCEKLKDTVEYNNVTTYITSMFLSNEDTIAEIMDVVGKLRSGELKCKNLDPDKLEKWARTRWGMK